MVACAPGQPHLSPPVGAACDVDVLSSPTREPHVKPVHTLEVVASNTEVAEP